LKDPDHYLASDNVFDWLRRWAGIHLNKIKPFKFWKAYSGRKPFSVRGILCFQPAGPHLLKLITRQKAAAFFY
jgi:hypothetical protein